eukprot:1159554-Pelagomonas_calceolata.AAC.9
MLHRLKAFTCKPFLTVNIKISVVIKGYKGYKGKRPQSRRLTASLFISVVICFNSRTENSPHLVYDNEVLPYSDTFRYLGMIFDKKNIYLHYAAEEAFKPCLVGMARICAFAHQHQIAHRLHTYLRLFKTYVIPAGIYASQVWVTPYLQQGHEMDDCIQKWLFENFEIHLGIQIGVCHASAG